MALLSTLPDNFLTNYVRWGYTQTDAPAFYHVSAALTLLATLAPRDLVLEDAPGGSLNANFYSLVIGRQGYERKTTAIKPTLHLLKEAGLPGYIGADPASGEGLVASLAENPKQLLMFPDYADFLARTKSRAGGNYASDLKTKFLHAWDGLPMTRRKSRETVICDEPRLNFVGAINAPLLSKHAEPEDFTGGFFSRVCITSARRERRGGTGRGSGVVAWKRLVAWAQITGALPPTDFGKCLGLTADAWKLWGTFDLAVEESVSLLPSERFAGVNARAPTHALKIAMLICVGLGHGHPNSGLGRVGWYIDGHVMSIAINLATRYYMGAVAVFDSVGGSKDMVDRAIVLDAVDTTWVPIGHVARQAKLLIKHVDPILQTLKEENLIEETSQTVEGRGSAMVRTFRRKKGAPIADGVQAALDVKAAVDEAARRVRRGLIRIDNGAFDLPAAFSSTPEASDDPLYSSEGLPTIPEVGSMAPPPETAPPASTSPDDAPVLVQFGTRVVTVEEAQAANAPPVFDPSQFIDTSGKETVFYGGRSVVIDFGGDG
jgi:hypothetical protein